MAPTTGPLAGVAGFVGGISRAVNLGLRMGMIRAQIPHMDAALDRFVARTREAQDVHDPLRVVAGTALANSGIPRRHVDDLLALALWRLARQHGVVQTAVAYTDAQPSDVTDAYSALDDAVATYRTQTTPAEQAAAEKARRG